MELPLRYFYRMDKGTCMWLPFSIEGNTLRSYSMSFCVRFSALPVHKVALFKTANRQICVYNSGVIGAEGASGVQRFLSKAEDDQLPQLSPPFCSCGGKMTWVDNAGGLNAWWRRLCFGS